MAEFSEASPPTSGIAPITALLMVLVAVLTFQFFEKSTRKATNFLLLWLVGGVLISLCANFFISLRFIYSYDGGRVFLGCGWTSKAETLARALSISTERQCPGQYQDIFEKFEGKVADVFNSENVAYVEMVGIATWLVFFLSVAAVIALFVTYQQGRKIKT